MLPRRLHHLVARLALAWFALALGVAAASPLVAPRAMQLVCSAGGAAKLLVDSGEGLVEAGSHTLDCALCLAGGAPPPALTRMALGLVAQPPHHLVTYADAPRQAPTSAPLPARGPPSL